MNIPVELVTTSEVVVIDIDDDTVELDNVVADFVAVEVGLMRVVNGKVLACATTPS